MHGLGNDFIVVEGACDVRAMCDRRRGIGADQVLVCERKAQHVRVTIYNQDGSEAEMCGNGLRCVALYMVKVMGLSDLLIETRAGMKRATFYDEDRIAVDIGPARLGRGFEEPFFVDGAQCYEVSMGNPHAIFFDVPREPAVLGAHYEHHELFAPHRSNIEWVRPLSREAIDVCVFERGAGLTEACGSGACASAVASFVTGRVGQDVQVHLPGGVLRVSMSQDLSSVVLEGAARFVFSGRYEPSV